MHTVAFILSLLDPSAVDIHLEVQAWRSQYNLPAQQLDLVLCRQAQNHSDWMARHRSFTHGVHDQVIGIGYPSPRQAVAGWIYSPPHRAWLLSRNRRVGWAVSRNSTRYWSGVIRD